jgi:ferric-dicitrate binding protein FerR (iron transport regulator)
VAINGWSKGAIAAAGLSVLALLEYVNYYHRQLQVIDNKADFQRLLSTGRFKRARLARALATYRQR